ncbi:MAG: GMC family oxidoreductase [Betaproteobacteria bacterium]|nr:GMC family oxidoreductase [Betaproteobacteria bacterium]
MIRDPVREGLAAGWRVIDASTLERAQDFEADVVIVGTGAGGGVSAEILAAAGLRVVLVEEGPLRSSSDFRMREAEAYPELYQESAARKTLDKAINILQGRCVGGSTTVNWTSSFRTPPATLAFWRARFGLADYTEEALAPWFRSMEERLGVHDWTVAPNANNGTLCRGGERLGIAVEGIRRNVRGCWNLGYCGLGCPTNAKQSMLVTTLPAALSRGAVLLTRLRAQRLLLRGDGVEALECVALGPDGIHPRDLRLRVHARHYVLAAGALGSPALLLRSAAPDPQGVVGARTFLHPVVISAAVMPERVAGFSGAPQSLYSDHFLERDPVDGPMGFKLEAPPLHPVLFATTLHGFGTNHTALMSEFPRTQVLLALLRDGFHPESAGGRVQLRDDGTPVLDYPLNRFFFDAARRALLAMAEIQFAAGAQRVTAVHERCPGWAGWRQARDGIAALPLEPHLLRVVSAHVMGGCAMGDDPRRSVVDGRGRHHGIGNLSVFDGSVFPTSLGANPQLSIYAMVARNVTLLARELGGTQEAPAAETAGG